jgi:perosamine synthetase
MRQIRLGRNAVPPTARKAILGVFDSGQYSPGPKVKQFEDEWAKAHQARHAVFVNSGTDALRLSLLAMKEKYGWSDGAEIAVPAVTFVATVNVIIQANLKPFFVDVGMYDFLINPNNLKRRIETSHTKLVAVMPVHLFGQRCGDEIYQTAKHYRLKVLEDSCETILNQPRGDVSCHSTYMAHHVTTGVGGFAVTDDEDLNELIRSYANHGRNTNYIPGYRNGNDIKKRFRFDRVGYSCRGTEFEAVLGLSQMANLKRNVNNRRSVFVDLLDAVGDLDDFQTVGVTDNTCMMFPLVIKETSKIKKYDVCEALEKNGVETRDMMPITSQPCYRNIVNENDFPVAKHVNKNGFYIPCNPDMTKHDVERIRLILAKQIKR